MQGARGWGNFKPHSSEATTKQWQGQWESHGCADGSGWETGTWDQLAKGDSSHYEEFENVMRWDDSGAQEAFEVATKIQEGSLKGSTSSLSLPSPDLYIQAIDWDSREDLKLPDSAETFSQPGERTGQRKRGRKGGAFRRQFDSQDFTNVADQKQNDSSQRDGLPCQLQSSVQDRSKSNWSAQWNSQSHRRQNFGSSNWQDHGQRNSWDEGHNSQTDRRHYRWQQTNVSFEPARGWGCAVPHHSSHGLSNDRRYQATSAAHGNEWMCKGEVSGQGFQQQSVAHSNRSLKEQHHVDSHLPDNSRRWRQQQQPYRPWQ